MDIQCIYQLKCKDNNIKETYIGSTVNYRKRMNDHKSSSLNIKDAHYCLPIYMFINVNGGISNWYSVVLEKCIGLKKTQLKCKEQMWMRLLNPQLNCYYATGINIVRKNETKKKWNMATKECSVCGSILLKNNLKRHMINLHGSHTAIKPKTPLVVEMTPLLC